MKEKHIERNLYFRKINVHVQIYMYIRTQTYTGLMIKNVDLQSLIDVQIHIHKSTDLHS